MPRKLTPALHEQIVEAVRAGNYLKTAAEAAGVPESTVRTWRDQGKAAYEANTDSPFLAFYLDYTKAEAEAEKTFLADLVAALRGKQQNWAGYMTILERRRPEHWKRREVVETQEKPAETLEEQIQRIQTMPRAELEELLTSLQAQVEKPHLKVVNG
jgi:hypothetical protein